MPVSTIQELCLILSMCVAVWQGIEAAKLISPVILKADAKSSTEIQLKWQDLLRKSKRKFYDRKFYTVKYYRNRKEKETYLYKNAKRTSITLDSLQPDTTYFFAVKTTKGKKISGWSKVVSTKTLQKADIEDLQTVPLSSTSILLSWQPPRQPDNRSYGYEIFWQEIQKEETPRRTIVSNSATSHVFDNLIPDRQYSFMVQTLSDRKTEMKSQTVYEKTFSDKPSKPPRDVTMHVITPRLVLLKWNPPPARKRNGEIITYKIQYRRKTNGRGDLCVVNTPPQSREYNLTDLAAGATYKVRIGAKTVNGTGPFSKWESFILPERSSGDRNSRMTSNKGKKKDRNEFMILLRAVSPQTPLHAAHVLNISLQSPENLVAEALSSTSVRLSWKKPETDPCCPIIAYSIRVRSVEANQWERNQVTGTKTEAVVKELDPGTLYAFNVTAFNTRGSSKESTEVITTTLDAVEPVIEQIHKVSFIEGQRGFLRCVARGDPIPKVSWTRENETVPFYVHSEINLNIHNAPHISMETKRENGTIEKSLVFSHIYQSDAGNYVCLASNVAGNISMTTDLEVNVPPSIFDAVHSTWVKIGGSTNMTCAVKGVPMPTVSWIRLRDLTEIKEGPKANGRMGRLHVKTWVDELKNIVYKTVFISRVKLSDAGNYSCNALNGYGTAFRVAELNIEVPPPPPVENLHAIALSPSKVSIFWTRPSEYIHPISTYKLTYRREDDNKNMSFNITRQAYELNSLEPQTIYKVKVTAYSSHVAGTDSKTVEVKTLPDRNLEPANVSAVALNSSIIQLDWEAPKSIARLYIKGYNIYYKRESDTIPVKLFITGNTNKQFLIGLGKRDTYFLKIATVMTWGAEFPSQWIQIKKQKKADSVACLPLKWSFIGSILLSGPICSLGYFPFEPVVDKWFIKGHEPTPPNPPRNLTSSSTATSIRLSWRPPKQTDVVELQHTGYRFAYGMESRNRMKHWNISEKVTSLTLQDLVPGTMYKLYLQATNDDGESDTIYKLVKTLEVRPGPVLGAVASAMSSTEVLVQWIAPKKGPVTRYHVRYWRPGKRDKESAWLFYPNSQYIAGSLRKNSAYRFEVIPYNKDQTGETTVLFAKTMVDRPEEPPRSVKIKFINATAMTVHWEVPRKEYQNGPIAGYKIVFKLKGGKRLATFSVDGDRSNYTFKGLEPSQTYKVHVAAMTAKGGGPYSKWLVATTDKIDMTPPESPTSIQITSTSDSIHVWWTPPRDIGVPVNGYILGYGRYIPEVFRTILGPTTHTYTITKLRHNSDYIISVRAFNNIGESSPKFLVGKTKEDLKYTFPLKAPAKVKAVTLSNNEIVLSWFDPSLGKLQKRVDGRYYLIRLSAVNNDVYQFVNATMSPFVVINLRVFTKYEFSVRAVRGNDQSGWSLPQFNRTFPSAPLDAPRDLTVLMDSKRPSTLTLTWQPPKFPNGIIEEYFLYKTSDPLLDLKYWVVETTHGTKMIKTIHDVTPHTTLHFRVQARNVAGYGPLSDMVIYTPATDSTAAPSNVSVSALNGNRSTSVEVNWEMPEKPTAQITGYLVYYRVSSQLLDDDVEDDADDLSWMVHDERGLSTVILDLQHNTTYLFKVGARYSGGFGPVSELVIYTTPAKDGQMVDTAQKTDVYEEEDIRNDVPLPPSEITAEGATNSIRLAWVAPSVNKSANVEFYRLGYGELFPDTTQINVNATDSFYIIQHLKPETQYIVSVRAVNSEGTSRPVITTVMTTP